MSTLRDAMNPASQSGYSGTPLPRKLGISAATRAAVLSAPPGFALEDVPPAHTRLRGSFDVIVQFADSQATLERRLGRLIEAEVAADAPRWLDIDARGYHRAP